MNVNEQLTAKDRDGISIGLVMALKSATKQAVSSFDNFITALKAAGLTDTLDGEGPFTIFAPDDNAFRMQGLSADAMTPEIAKLHVVQGTVKLSNQKVDSLGGPIQVKRGREWVKVNGAVIKRPDVKVSNGVIHVMDEVMMP